jgi:(S)-ureidoglycine aminohydrolase
MSVLRFQPGASLPNVEIHDEEHGLYMLRGAGLYLLDAGQHSVREGDFIYMAPYCPQSFTAIGAEPVEYLLYKDVFRDGF